MTVTFGMTSVQVATQGRVPGKMREMAAQKAESLLRFAAGPVLSARVTLVLAPDPAVPRPAIAQAILDVNGRIVRAQAAAPTMRAAIGRLAARLRVRLDREGRDWTARRGALPGAERGGEPSEWRHQSIPAFRADYFPRPAADRQVVARLSYAAGPLTPDEAAAELDMLDYDFHLFPERSTGEPSVIYRVSDGYRLAQVHPKPGRLGPLPPGITLSRRRAPHLDLAEAVDRLELPKRPFLFFVAADSGRPSLLYHRYDGHYGLVGLGDVR